MKNIAYVFLGIVLGAGLAISINAKASTCDEFNPCIANGPIVAQIAGGRFLKPGQEDCPAWFPYFGCYTFRGVGIPFKF